MRSAEPTAAQYVLQENFEVDLLVGQRAIQELINQDHVVLEELALVRRQDIAERGAIYLGAQNFRGLEDNFPNLRVHRQNVESVILTKQLP